MSFWTDVRALQREIAQQVQAGAGSRSLVNAIAAQGQPKAQPAAPRPKPPASPKRVVALPQGSPVQERMSAREYREYMGLG